MSSLLLVLAQEESDGSGAAGGIFAALLGGVGLLIWLAVVVLMVAALWKIFEKAGEPGWAAIVPLYNLIILLKIIGKPLWWIVLFVVPCVNIVAAVLLAVELAKAFGKGIGFAIGMVLVPFVFYPVLGFGSAEYRRP